MPTNPLPKLIKALRDKLAPWFAGELVEELEKKEQAIWEMKRVIDEYKDFVNNFAGLAKEGSEYGRYVEARKRKSENRLSEHWDSLEHDVFLTLFRDECHRDQKNIYEFTVSTYSITDAKEVCTAKAEAYREYGKLRLDTIKTAEDFMRGGFGSKMLGFLKEFCRTNGIREIYGTIGTSPNMDETKLRGFYVKNGFAFDRPRFSCQL